MQTVRRHYGLWELMLILLPIALLSQNAAVSGSSFNMGFGVATGPNTAVTSAVGEVLVGPSEGENTRTASGFLVVVLQQQTPLAIDDVPALPAAFALHPNYPNPFNPVSTIRYELPLGSDVSLVIYDILGREVARLVQGEQAAGYHQVVWDGRAATGREVPSGIYIARLVTGEYSKAIKMVLLK